MFENKIPYLRGKLSQKEMKEDAMKSIRKRKKGKYKLTYDKATKTIIAVPTEKDKLAKEELLDELGKVFARGIYAQLEEIVAEHFRRKDFTKGYEIKQIQQKPTVSEKEMMDELFFGQGFGLNDVRRMIDWLKSKGFEIGR